MGTAVAGQPTIRAFGILGRALAIYRARAVQFLRSAVLVLALPVLAASYLFDAIGGRGALGGAVVLGTAALFAFQGFTAEAVARDEDSGPLASPGSSRRRSLTLLMAAIAFGCVQVAISALGWIWPPLYLLALLAVEPWLAPWAPVIVLERRRLFASLSRACRLVRGNFWGVLRVGILVTLVLAATGVVHLLVAGGGTGLELAVDAVLRVLVAPLVVISLNCVYLDLDRLDALA